MLTRSRWDLICAHHHQAHIDYTYADCCQCWFDLQIVQYKVTLHAWTTLFHLIPHPQAAKNQFPHLRLVRSLHTFEGCNKPVKLYNVNLTGSFAGLFPKTICINRRSHAAAIRLYRSALKARIVSSGENTVLESQHGFQFQVQSVRSKLPASVRLALPPRADRAYVARQLAAGSGVSHKREGIIVKDPFEITWTLAWSVPSYVIQYFR